MKPIITADKKANSSLSPTISGSKITRPQKILPTETLVASMSIIMIWKPAPPSSKPFITG